MKKIVICLLGLLLVSCNEGSSSILNNNSIELSEDLKTLLIAEPSYIKDELPFSYSASIISSSSKENYYIVTCEFSYLQTDLDDVHFICVPYSYSLTNNLNNVANVGYDGNIYKLRSEVSVEEYTFKGFRISYLTDNNLDGIKVFFKSEGYENITFGFENKEIENK